MEQNDMEWSLAKNTKNRTERNVNGMIGKTKKRERNNLAGGGERTGTILKKSRNVHCLSTINALASHYIFIIMNFSN